MIHQEELTIETQGRGTYELTRELQSAIGGSGIRKGLATLFVHHTSASLIINENADPDVRRDLDAFLDRLVPDGDRLFVHTAEGPDDMPAHVKVALTATSLSIPVLRGRADLGTWQGVFLWEHRRAPHRRRLTLTILG